MSCSVRRVGAAAGLALLLGAGAGCGFHPAAEEPLPAAVQTVYVASGQPYGALENLLRGALARSGSTVVYRPQGNAATLQIVSEQKQRRVLAVDARGRPTEFALEYQVSFRVLAGSGTVLIPTQDIELRREYAFSINVALGAGREESQIFQRMQQEAASLILLRVQRVGSAAPVSRSAPAAGT